MARNCSWDKLKNYKVYSIVLEKYKEETLNIISLGGQQCRNFFDSDNLNTPFYGIVYFYFVNQYIDVLNYENPNIKLST